MAWNFADSFDLYAATTDMINGYWDSFSGPTGGFTAGRFAGSRAFQPNTNTAFTKSSGVNDAVHHLAVSFEDTGTLSGSYAIGYLELLDGAAAQCSIVFRADGAILLTSGGPAGTTLATYTGAVTAASTWYAFEFEVVINGSTGSFAVRKNGNTANDFTATGLNTAPSGNNYANKLTIGSLSGTTNSFDDLFWRSGSSSGSWLGDVRCYARMPIGNASAQFTPLNTSMNLTPYAYPGGSTNGISNGDARYTNFTPSRSGAVGSLQISLNTGYTGNMKCSIFADASGVPGAVLGSATTIANPATGTNTFTFPTPVPVAAATQYWVGWCSDTTSGVWWTFGTNMLHSATPYASFPAASPSTSSAAFGGTSPNITITLSNYSMVSEAQQDGATTYVYDSNPGDADFYAVGPGPSATPANILAVVTRGYAMKSNAGSRLGAVQLKSGATTVASPNLVLSTSGWQWAWRMDLTDPNTGSAWTKAAVDNAQIGPIVAA